MNDSNFGLPTASYCRQIRTQHGLTMPVLYDPDGRLAAPGLQQRHVHLVLEPGRRVFHRAESNDRTFQGAINTLLARP